MSSLGLISTGYSVSVNNKTNLGLLTMTDEQYGYNYFHGIGSNYPKSGYETQIELPSVFRRYVEFIMSIVENKLTCQSSIRWLDIGCAYGFLVAEACRLGLNGYGVDISKHAISQARKIFPHLKARFTNCGIGDLLNIFAEESFDVISMIEVMEHLKNPYQSIKIVHKLLKPKGLLLITTPNPKRLKTDKDVTHVNVHDITYWKYILANQGFKVKYPCLMYDPRKHGFILVKLITRNRLLRDCYSTIKALWLSRKSSSYYILAFKA